MACHDIKPQINEYVHGITVDNFFYCGNLKLEITLGLVVGTGKTASDTTSTGDSAVVFERFVHRGYRDFEIEYGSTKYDYYGMVSRVATGSGDGTHTVVKGIGNEASASAQSTETSVGGSSN